MCHVVRLSARSTDGSRSLIEQAEPEEIMSLPADHDHPNEVE